MVRDDDRAPPHCDVTDCSVPTDAASSRRRSARRGISLRLRVRTWRRSPNAHGARRRRRRLGSGALAPRATPEGRRGQPGLRRQRHRGPSGASGRCCGSAWRLANRCSSCRRGWSGIRILRTASRTATDASRAPARSRSTTHPDELKPGSRPPRSTPAITALPGSCTSSATRVSGTAAPRSPHSRKRAVPDGALQNCFTNSIAILLTPLETYVADHRRLPSPADLDKADQIVDLFGSIRGGFNVIRQATGSHRWSDVDLGTPKKSTQRFEEHLDDLQPLIDFVTDRGRPPSRR